MRWNAVVWAAPAFCLTITVAAQDLSWDAATERGLQLQQSGRYSDAKRAFLGALDQADAFPPQDWRRPITLANLASIYQDLGEVALARDTYERAITGFEQRHGKAHPVLAKPLHNLATLYVEQGQFARAERLSRRALALHADGAELSAADRVMLRQGLAAALLGKGRTAEAEAIHREILDDLQARRAPPLRQIAQIRNNLALLCTRTARPNEALFEMREAVAAEERAVGTEHPELLKLLSNLAAVYSMMGNNGDAEAILKRALAIAERSLGEGEAYGRILSTYAVVLRKLNRRTEGKEAEKRAAAILSAVGRDPSLRYTVDIGDLLRPPRPR